MPYPPADRSVAQCVPWLLRPGTPAKACAATGAQTISVETIRAGAEIVRAAATYLNRSSSIPKRQTVLKPLLQELWGSSGAGLNLEEGAASLSRAKIKRGQRSQGKRDFSAPHFPVEGAVRIDVSEYLTRSI